MAQPSLPLWEACDRWEHAVYEQEQRLLAQQQRAPLDSHGVKNLENERLDLLAQSLVKRFPALDVSGNPELRSLTPDLQHQLIDGLIHNLSSYQQDLSAATVIGPILSDPRREPSQAAAPSQLAGTVPAMNVPVYRAQDRDLCR